MYKVFYKQRTVFFIENEKNYIDKSDSEIHLFKNKNLLNKELNKFLDKLELSTLFIIHKDIDFAFKEFSKLYEIIEAAGGLVKNEKNEILVIYRRDVWDLPKGEIEKNELPNIAAIREVEEECGITNLNIIDLIDITYHTYKLDNKDILKRTYWYEMACSGNQEPRPQIEEEITQAEWINTDNLDEIVKNTFPSIIDVLLKGNIVSSE